MGDPKFLRRTYETPKHPWEAGRMADEAKLLTKYGLKNKRELWGAQSDLRALRRQAMELQARRRTGETQAEREAAGLLGRLTRLGVLPTGSPTIDDILALQIEDLLTRRLDWVVFRKGLAPTAKGARKLIVHGHFAIGGHRVTRPGYLVQVGEEGVIDYAVTSPIRSEEHSIRVLLREREMAQAAAPPAAPTGPEGGP